MQYIWQHRLWQPTDMRTVDGRRVCVLDPGRLNTDAGPDFFNAKVIIDGHTWVGDVEIHVRATDWHRHHHDGDAAYDSVILHVVDKDDTVIHRRNGEDIPQVCMPCAAEFAHHYSVVTSQSAESLPCAEALAAMPAIYLTDWLENLGYERVYEKAERIDTLLERFDGSWEQACYVTLARALGFGVNGDPFERLALSLPLRFVAKHCDSLTAVEALLFGQSGLLATAPADDEYVSSLKREYAFLAHKFSLTPLACPGWKMSRMRPANFPHRRIAFLASMLHDGFSMLRRMLEIATPQDAMQVLNPTLSGYWTHRYTFGSESARAGATMSKTAINGLVINVVAPIMFHYATTHGNETLRQRAINLLMATPAEQNSKVRVFEAAGLQATDAFRSQALLQLRRGYCEQRKCLYCRIGHRMLAARAKRHV